MSGTRDIRSKSNIPGTKTMTLSKCQESKKSKKSKELKSDSEYKITSPVIRIIIRTPQEKIDEKKKLKKKFVPDTSVCVKDFSSTDVRDKDGRKLGRREKTRLIFPEMRGGVLYSRCWCLHRDGLQDHCPLTQCQGQPECLVKPWAVCPAGKFTRSRFPEMYPKKSDTDCTT